MRLRFFKKNTRRVRRRKKSPDQSYLLHKEQARTLVNERLIYWNTFYKFSYNRVAIRNQRSRWGSCSSKRNLNFNYRLVFLPVELVDYVIVHELCHLKHLDHSNVFWDAVGETLIDYEERKMQLRTISKNLRSYMHSMNVK